jgi:hypothetical protein
MISAVKFSLERSNCALYKSTAGLAPNLLMLLFSLFNLFHMLIWVLCLGKTKTWFHLCKKSLVEKVSNGSALLGPTASLQVT